MMRQLKIVTQITNRDNPSLETYLAEISRIELISAEREVELAQRIKSGDERAVHEFARANLRFVVSVAKQYQNQGLSLPDLINEGNLGLIKAVRRFDETRGFKFISYGVTWIRQSILQALAEQGRIVRLPSNKIGLYNRATKAYTAFEQEYERAPSTEELAEILDSDESEIDMVLTGNNRHVSLDASPPDSEELTFGDMLPGDMYSDSDTTRSSLRDQIKESLKCLKPREAEVVNAYFNLGGEFGETIEDLGKKYDLTRERIRQIKERAIKRLQKSTYSRQLKQYLG